MPPYIDNEESEEPQVERLKPFSADDWKFKLHPVDFPLLVVYTISAFWGVYILLTSAKFLTIVYTFVLLYVSMLGVMAGAHRLWSHKAYKAKLPLQIFLAFLCLMTHQRSIYSWVKKHRQHHQYSDTDADPHNPSRGFFFAQFGWLLVEPHPEVVKREKLIDLSDILSNPVIKFEYKYYTPLCIIFSYAIPTYIPTLWGESLYVAYMCNILRVYLMLHLLTAINSFGHLLGYKPIDATVPGTQTQLLGLALIGEGFHNFHHSFPFDYRCSEIGDTKYNPTTVFIDFMAKIGQAYDLKSASEDMVRNRVLRKGDGTDMYYIPNNEGKQKFFCLNFFKKNENCSKNL